MIKRIRKEYLSFASELGAFAPWREDFQIREFSAPEHLCQSHKFQAYSSTRRNRKIYTFTFVLFASFVVEAILFFFGCGSAAVGFPW
jgi:hypothetical protein